MKLAKEWGGNLADLMSEYNYQPDLTRKLDSILKQTFEQSLANEIVLWRINRYASLSHSTLTALNGLEKNRSGQTQGK